VSIFSSKASSHHNEGASAALMESSSVIIVDLWPNINSLCDAEFEGAFVMATCGHSEASTLHLQLGTGGLRRSALINALLDRPPGPSSAPSNGYGGGSAKKKAAHILSEAPGDISPRMKRSFVERRYSPSTDMDQSEWEIM
jgi:hypothetical protein